VSAKYIKAIVKPKNKQAAARFEKLVELVNAKAFDALAELDTEQMLDDPAHCLGAGIEAKSADGVLRMEFDIPTSCAADELFAFFKFLGARDIEASVHNSQAGETSYFAKDKFVQRPSRRKWKWLQLDASQSSSDAEMQAASQDAPLPLQPWSGPIPAVGMNCLMTHFNTRRVVPMRRFEFKDCKRVELGNVWPPLVLNGRLGFRPLMTDKYITVDEATFGDERILLQREHLGPAAGDAASTDLMLFEESLDGDVMRPAIGVCEIETGRVLAMRDLGISPSSALRAGPQYVFPCRTDVIAANIHTLEEKWHASPGHNANTLSACERTDSLVIVGQEMQISCMGLTDGRLRWTTDPGQWGFGEQDLKRKPARWRYNSNAHIYDNVVVVMGPASHVIGLDLEDGRLLWRHRLHEVFDPVSYHPCVAENGKVYAFASGQLFVLDARTGTPERVHRVAEPTVNPTAAPSNAAFCDCTDTHFVGVTSHGTAYAIDLTTGAVTWLMQLGHGVKPGTPFVLCNNRLYIRHGDGCTCIVGGGGFRADGAQLPA
jgi:hypothetical protein